MMGESYNLDVKLAWTASTLHRRNDYRGVAGNEVKSKG